MYSVDMVLISQFFRCLRPSEKVSFAHHLIVFSFRVRRIVITITIIIIILIVVEVEAGRWPHISTRLVKHLLCHQLLVGRSNACIAQTLLGYHVLAIVFRNLVGLLE